jgi:cyclohexanecarboxyl-CoA dehydrogenase
MYALSPGYQAREKVGVMDMDLVREMGALGLIAPELPQEFGGMGADFLFSGAIIEEPAKADFTFGYVPLLASLNCQMLSNFAKPKITQHWLPRVTAGELILAIALTEPKGGSDAANLGLRMERDGEHYVINGEKTAISANQTAKAVVTFARTGRAEDKADGVSAILIPLDLPGITTSKFADMGQNSIGHGSIWFDNVRVPAENLWPRIKALPINSLILTPKSRRRAHLGLDQPGYPQGSEYFSESRKRVQKQRCG